LRHEDERRQIDREGNLALSRTIRKAHMASASSER
jgi:hypothetical protein